MRVSTWSSRAFEEGLFVTSLFAIGKRVVNSFTLITVTRNAQILRYKDLV